MHISAKDLYKELKGFGRLPRTFKLQYMTIQTDTLTSKTREKSTGVYKYALVMVKLEGKSVTVDFDRLRDFTKKMGREMLEVRVMKQSTLKMYYDNGDFVLFHMPGTPGATVDLNKMVEREPVAKV